MLTTEPPTFVINNLRPRTDWRKGCFLKGMTLTMIVIALQVVAVLVSVLRDSGEDTRFEGDKLGFRS